MKVSSQTHMKVIMVVHVQVAICPEHLFFAKKKKKNKNKNNNNIYKKETSQNDQPTGKKSPPSLGTQITQKQVTDSVLPQCLYYIPQVLTLFLPIVMYTHSNHETYRMIGCIMTQFSAVCTGLLESSYSDPRTERTR